MGEPEGAMRTPTGRGLGVQDPPLLTCRARLHARLAFAAAFAAAFAGEGVCCADTSGSSTIVTFRRGTARGTLSLAPEGRPLFAGDTLASGALSGAISGTLSCEALSGGLSCGALSGAASSMSVTSIAILITCGIFC